MFLEIHKVKINEKPEYLYEMYDWSYSYQTRQASKGLIKPKGTPRLDISKRSFKHRALDIYNSLPNHILETTEDACFKRQVKIWIKEETPINILDS